MLGLCVALAGITYRYRCFGCVCHLVFQSEKACGEWKIPVLCCNSWPLVFQLSPQAALTKFGLVSTAPHPHTHRGARTLKQRLRPPHHPAHFKTPTDREADRAFPLSNHWGPALTGAPRLTPNRTRPSRLLHSHRERVSQPHPPPVSPHTSLISALENCGASDSREQGWRVF